MRPAQLLSRRLALAGIAAIALTALVPLAGSGSAAHAAETLKVGIMAGPEEEISGVAKKVAAAHGLDVQLITFRDYALPNEALETGDLDANAFQHKPFLDAQIKARGYHIVSVGLTIVEPIVLYSHRIKSLAELKAGDEIGIPNDPSNGGRALNLLAQNKVITLAPGKGLLPTLADITANPKQLKFVELDAAQLPRSLDDLTAAVINTGYAIEAGLNPSKDGIIQEERQGNPYANFIAARENNKDDPRIKTWVQSFQSKEVRDFLQARYKGSILPAW